MWDELGIDPCDDPKAIRRAYAARLKTLDPDRDPAAFTRLRGALEWALAAAKANEQTRPPVRDQRPQEPEPDQGRDAVLSLPVYSTGDDRPAFDDRSSSDQPSAEDGGGEALEELQVGAAERALLDSIETALARCDAGEAATLYYRAAAIGVVPLHGAPRLLGRLFAIVIDDRSIDREVFRHLARTVGWDKQGREEAMSELRQRVLARLAAEDWYDSLVTAADQRGRTARKKAKLARVMLGRVGRYWRPRVDRTVLKILLDQYRTHETWLRDRIDPAWVSVLERRWRRREIVSLVFLFIFLAAMLLNGVRLFAVEAAAGTLSFWMAVLGICFAAFLLWLLKLLATSLQHLLTRISHTNFA